MSKSDKAKLAAGAEKIRKAEKALTTKTKLDGTLAAATKRLIELHNEIQIGIRATFTAAIQAGKILCNVRASRKGDWLKWLDDNVPFSQSTAWRYMECYKNRADYSAVTNLADAYRLLKDRPSKRKRRKPDPVVEELVSKGIAKDQRDARRIIKQRGEPDEAPAVADAEAPVPQPVSQPSANGWQPDALNESDLTKSEGNLIKHMRAYFSSVPTGRAKVFMRFVCEKVSGEL